MTTSLRTSDPLPLLPTMSRPSLLLFNYTVTLRASRHYSLCAMKLRTSIFPNSYSFARPNYGDFPMAMHLSSLAVLRMSSRRTHGGRATAPCAAWIRSANTTSMMQALMQTRGAPALVVILLAPQKVWAAPVVVAEAMPPSLKGLLQPERRSSLTQLQFQLQLRSSTAESLARAVNVPSWSRSSRPRCADGQLVTGYEFPYPSPRFLLALSNNSCDCCACPYPLYGFSCVFTTIVISHGHSNALTSYLHCSIVPLLHCYLYK